MGNGGFSLSELYWFATQDPPGYDFMSKLYIALKI